MSATAAATITKEAMTAGFPTRIPAIEGDITLKELLRVFQHLFVCAQSTVTSHHARNFLYLVVPTKLWALYSNTAYPQAPGNPGAIPPYHQNNTPLQNEVVKQAFLSARKHYEEYLHMNKALTERFFYLSSPKNTSRDTMRCSCATQTASSGKRSTTSTRSTDKKMRLRSKKIKTT